MAERNPDPAVGQLWADNDPRNRGRRFRVLSVNDADDTHPEPYVRVQVEHVSRNVRSGEVGEQRTIKVRRMRTRARNGYAYVEGPPVAEAYPEGQQPTGDAL